MGRSSDIAPTAVYVDEGELLFGDAAERRGASRPDRLVREFKRRVGDDVPIVAGDRRLAAEDLYAATVAWVIGVANEREGGHPAGIAITVPVSWGQHRRTLVADALAQRGWGEAELITEPEAAARHYESTNPLAEGHALAVYDLGGGTFDAVVLRKAADGTVRVVGEPVGLPDLGGADFDDVVIRHVLRAGGPAVAALLDAPGGRLSVNALRRECVEAKESLSFDSEAVIPVLAGGTQETIRLTRVELEDMIEPDLARTVGCFARALDRAQVDADGVDAILLTGGSSRIPRIAQLLSETFERPIAIDADPKAIIALGAARVAADAANARVLAAAVVDADADADPLAELVATAAPVAASRRPWFRRTPSSVMVVAGSLVVAAGIVVTSASALGTHSPEVSAPAALFLDDARALGSEVQLNEPAQLVSFPTESEAEVEAEKPVVPESGPQSPRSDFGGAKAKARGVVPTPTSPAPQQATGDTPPAPASRNDSPTKPSGESPSNPSTADTRDDGPQTPAPQPTVDPEPEPTTPAEENPSPTPEPVPSDPAPEPTPTDPPADPTPTETPAADPPSDPAPSEAPPADPAPSETVDPSTTA
ncbi:Hsp70 family protein [Microbacterium sp. P04]|uniref:Hsp70 family protein n=1 Tax=Microbacterium sp. P04 TaxID=3366947 RepID=UPI0037476E0A